MHWHVHTLTYLFVNALTLTGWQNDRLICQCCTLTEKSVNALTCWHWQTHLSMHRHWHVDAMTDFFVNALTDLFVNAYIGWQRQTYHVTNILTTRIEPVGEPYREVCLSPWKGNWRMSWNRIDWRNVLLSEKNYFHENELKENGNMT